MEWFSQDALAQDIHNSLGPKGVNFGDVTSMINLSEEMFCPYQSTAGRPGLG